ncbi:hypothetical protein [Symmachiella macrocystis]|nr:hypothetical protein [Symmachiella macrocystis]
MARQIDIDKNGQRQVLDFSELSFKWGKGIRMTVSDAKGGCLGSYCLTCHPAIQHFEEYESKEFDELVSIATDRYVEGEYDDGLITWNSQALTVFVTLNR